VHGEDVGVSFMAGSAVAARRGRDVYGDIAPQSTT
jgi:hypothetical protein